MSMLYTMETDVLVIGAGQAGLAAASALSRASLRFLIVDAGRAVGDSWRERYDTLTLFTPRNISALPGLDLAGDPQGYATKDEFADYLAQYASRAGYEVMTGTSIVSLRHVDGNFHAVAQDGRTIFARAVIVATGAFRKPSVPAMAGIFSPAIRQMHVSQFRNASSVPHGPVLVVGDGASGRDAAVAISKLYKTVLSQGRPRKLLPQKILGRNIWWWLKILGLLEARPHGMIGRRMRKVDPFPARGSDDAGLREHDIDLKTRLVAVDGDDAVFADGSRMQPGTVIWATGYREDFAWIEIDAAIDADGKAQHNQGISPVSGLYFLGRPWQRNRASALIAGAGDDARFIVDNLKRRFVS